MTNSISTIEDLIRTKNPFAGNTIVRPLQIWGKSFPDVSSINAHASSAVLEAVAQVRRGERQTVGITITADKGLGKSHIISRIRHRLQADGDAVLVYMSKYDNLSQINTKLLQSIVSSLRAFGSQGVMQWQELAAALINIANNWNYTAKQYIDKFPSWWEKYSNKTVDKLTNLVLAVKSGINNPYILKAILWTLSEAHKMYAIHWLSGYDLTVEQSQEMGLPNYNKESQESEALNAVRQIIYLTSDYKVPVICFDELDRLEVDENGFTTAQVIASLAKDLYNNLESGVLLLAMYPKTWRDQVKSLPQAEAIIDRLVSERADRKPINLNYLNSDDVVALVSQWLQDFYQENQQTPPHPLYPFDDNQLREFGQQKPTVRAVLNWCADNFELDDHSYVKSAFENELTNVETAMESWLEDQSEIADALWLGFNNLIGETVEQVTIEAITKVDIKKQYKVYIDFKVIGKQEGKDVKIGLAVIQKSGGIDIAAALQRLIDYDKFDLTRGCLVRSKPIRPTAMLARERVIKLLKEQGGEWVLLQSQDIKPLLAISFVHKNRENYDVNEEQIFKFIKKKQLACNNPLIREILSDPSGQEPENLFDEDMPISIPQSVPYSAQST
ncbi:MAG: hypothetical protein F6J89_03140 [Symploca sp. SIO1C4]|uniref:Uncharacterized protein n=1 Tax=Symploca sp. SIO1C4 TaxID=2607765 RepID=A0A6B3MYX1_9CYAN|nr:hypothetical protein [Symploca sp. SIO1C4]